MEEKKQKITNKHYRQFLDKGIIEPINQEQILRALANIKGKRTREGRALLIAMYYSGARPNEVLRLKAKDIRKEDSYVLMRMQGSKGGLPRTIYLRYSKPLVKELYNYASGLFEEMLIFNNFRSNHVREVINKKGEVKEYIEIADKLRYYFKKWFANVLEGSIPPYFLRHSRFSMLSESGITMQEIRMLKGSKTMQSVEPYIHMSSRAAKKIAKKMN